jgi:ABC-type uncharacterized transport system ATPase subunit
MMIVKDDSSVIINSSFKLIDASIGVIYDRHMFILQATVQSDICLKSNKGDIYSKWIFYSKINVVSH